MEVGNIDEYAFRDYVIAHSRPGITGEDVDNALHKILVSIAPYKFDLLRKLSEKYDIYMLSNNNPIATKRTSGFLQKRCSSSMTHKRMLMRQSTPDSRRFTTSRAQILANCWQNM